MAVDILQVELVLFMTRNKLTVYLKGHSHKKSWSTMFWVHALTAELLKNF
jgi:hypothetical protein